MKCAIFFVLTVLLQITCGWEQGVRECCERVEPVLKNFPEPTHAEGETLWSSFYEQTEFLKILTNSSSPILSNNAVDILETLAKLSHAGDNSIVILRQLRQVYPAKAECYANVAQNSRAFLKALVTYIYESISNIGDTIVEVLNAFERRSRPFWSPKLDFKRLVDAARLNSNTIAAIANVAVEGNYAEGTYQIIAMLSLVSNLMLLSIHGTNANIGTVYHNEDRGISPTLRECFVAVDPLVADTTNLISEASFDSEAGIKDYLRKYADTIVSYNPRLEQLLGDEVHVAFTDNFVRRNLKK